MPLRSALARLAVLVLATTIFNQAVRPLSPLLGSETGFYLVNKTLLALLLLGFVLLTRQARACGLGGGANLGTLHLYWPMFALMALILLGPKNPPELPMLLALGGIALSVGFAEELMFRGLLFHWFRDQSVRTRILVSAFAFGGVHLIAVLYVDATAVIVSQSFFASGVGAVFAAARARDVSIWIPIAVHALFDFVAFAASGSIGSALADSPETVIRLLVGGALIWLWGGYLVWKAPRWEASRGRPVMQEAADPV